MQLGLTNRRQESNLTTLKWERIVKREEGEGREKAKVKEERVGRGERDDRGKGGERERKRERERSMPNLASCKENFEHIARMHLLDNAIYLPV